MSRRWLSTGPSIAALPLRLGFAAIFFAHGAQKLFGMFGGDGLAGTGKGFESIGLSPGLLWALLTGLAETGGALLLLLGLGTRLGAAGLLVVMAVAVYKVHWPNGFFLNWDITPGRGHGIEYNVSLIAGLFALLIYGGGAASVDRAIGPRRERPAPSPGPLPTA
jgi:putative oxidoreductase